MVTQRCLLLKVTICMLLVTKSTQSQTEDPKNTVFPDNFLLGAATASYQIEGGWNASDKGVNIWDEFTHDNPLNIIDHSNGDVACDSYNKYKEDIELLSDMGVDFYRFSLSWSRILPTGFINVVSKDGLNYYKNLIDKLLEKDIQPFVTLYHWDLPSDLEKIGGWMNELIVDYFADYARIVFRELGPKVKYFFTINEPSVFCLEGYGQTLKAPGKNLTGHGEYLCMHNVLKAHAKAYHIYDREFRDTQKGLLSIVAPCTMYFAKDGNDMEVEDIAFQFSCGWITHPIFSKTGDYPHIMKERIAENSKIQGYQTSRLPEFSNEWIDYIRGTADFFALNHYTSKLVEKVPKIPNVPWYNEIGVNVTVDPSWPSTASKWLKVVPQGLRRILNIIKNEYDNPPVIITENGFSDNGTLLDLPRIRYYHDYLKAMLEAIYEDGCDVKGFTAWSVLDNFEWNRGYTEKFGLVNVDFSSPNRTRTPKMSMKWFKNVIKQRRLVDFDLIDGHYTVVCI
ncbi:hypothetical protein KPH14_005859 [Odynerus spinipes]|uniref:beta-glucosidase n=1 Tax=Odynerus spinipes TaxID=1348599 RepID=A0AAD9RB90_9HYME|nr:hypothetical protein KPH14_005859 [Odynerus spinipes]